MFALIGATVGLVVDIIAVISLCLFVIIAPFALVAYVIKAIKERARK